MRDFLITPFAIVLSRLKVGNKSDSKMTPNRSKIISEVRNNPNVTAAQLSVIRGISVTAVQKNIEYLKIIGCIKRIEQNQGIGKSRIDRMQILWRKANVFFRLRRFERIHIAYRIYEKNISISPFSNKVVTFYLLHCQPHRSTKEVDFITLVVFGTCFLRQNYSC